MDPMARGGVRRYLDTTHPEEYRPNTGEVDLKELSLTGLADLYGSDKGTIKHNYAIVYEKVVDALMALNSQKRFDAHINVGEVGVACGASLRMWANYLPAGKIFGFDIRPDCGKLCEDLDNVSIIIQDATKFGSLNQYNSFFDLFVDDGSHISEDIVATFESCWQWVKPGGFYIIEDLSCTYKEEYTQSFKHTFGRDVKNKRETFLILVDALMKHCDTKKGSIEYMEYHPQLLVIRKKLDENFKSSV